MAAGNELGFEVLFGNGQVADEFRLRAHGLRAEKVTVYACKLKRTCSHAVYKVSGGAIDTWKSASSGGSYAGMDPEGLFWRYGVERWSCRVGNIKSLGQSRRSDGREVSYIFFIEADGVVLFHEAAGRHDSSI